MRTPRLLAATLLLAVAPLAACAGTSVAPETDSSESPSAEQSVEEVYVTQITTLENGDLYDAQRPDSMVLSEFTDAANLVWESWGGPSAVATGTVTGSWCYPDCAEGYDAQIVLCDIVDAHYQRFGIFGEFEELSPEDSHLGSPLYLGDIPYSEEEWYGCDGPADPNDTV